MSKKYKIAVDGFSSCGKSTLAKQVAEKLKITYIDSGAMYRAVALLAIESGCIQNEIINESCLKDKLKTIDLVFDKQSNHTILNGIDVEDKIRQQQVAGKVSKVATLDFVREKLVILQQKYGDHQSVIMDGRDIGTHVFPDAEVKLFLTADPRIRAERRYKELVDKGQTVTFDEILANVKERDHIDQTREIAPLRKANDAEEIDNSNLSREEQLQKALEIVSEKLNR